MLGAYHSMREIFGILGIPLNEAFKEKQLKLSIYHKSRHPITISATSLPAPLHILQGLLKASGFSLRDKWASVRFLLHLARNHFTLTEDCSVTDYLAKHCKSHVLIENFLEPLCLAALNTPMHIASMQLFMHTLRDAFSRQRTDSNLLLPKHDLGALLPTPAMQFIESHDGQVRLGSKVRQLHITDNQIEAVVCDNEQIQADTVILATSPAASLHLLRPLNETTELYNQIATLGSQPICTVYLRYPEEIRLADDMIGMTGTFTQWLFDRRFCDQPGLMAAVISAEGEHMAMDKDTLTQHVLTEIAGLFPHWPAPLETMVIREKRATFSAGINIQSLRPTQKTEIGGFYLAGDYTKTPYPGTIEGAVMSGIACARTILQTETH